MSWITGFNADIQPARAPVPADRGLVRLTAGVNAARHGAHRALLGRGYRAMLNGLTMLRPYGAAYNRPDAYVLDDLR